MCIEVHLGRSSAAEHISSLSRMDFRWEHTSRLGRLWSPLSGKEELKHLLINNGGTFPLMRVPTTRPGILRSNVCGSRNVVTTEKIRGAQPLQCRLRHQPIMDTVDRSCQPFSTFLYRMAAQLSAPFLLDRNKRTKQFLN